MMWVAIALTLPAPAPPEPGIWRVMAQSPDWVVAVQETEDMPRAGQSGTVYVLTTFSRPRESRTGPFRQGWVELSVTCPGAGQTGRYGKVWDRLAEDANPLPETPEPLSPPIAVRAFDGDPYLGPLALDICNGAHRDKPTVQGDWATVLRTLRARSEAGAN